MEGRICLITGATSGIGKAKAIGLAKLGATVIVGCRNEEKGGRPSQRSNLEAVNKKSICLLPTYPLRNKSEKRWKHLRKSMIDCTY
jgi:NAD(P)-dependent dehydrogenase (short-subunit alcohol dehydrogenase family)